MDKFMTTVNGMFKTSTPGEALMEHQLTEDDLGLGLLKSSPILPLENEVEIPYAEEAKEELDHFKDVPLVCAENDEMGVEAIESNMLDMNDIFRMQAVDNITRDATGKRGAE